MAPDFGGKPWSLVHYVCLKSALECIRPDACVFHYEYEPSGPWWELSRGLVTLAKIEAPRSIFGNPIPHPAHRADVVRLEKLIEHGGIYLDCDVFVHRDFDDLLRHSAVLGSQDARGSQGLCNAVMIAEARSPFLQKWYEGYRSFRGTGMNHLWDEHSVRLPLKLSRDLPDDIFILPPNAFFSPSYEQTELNKIFASAVPVDLDGKYANHLWEGAAWLEYLEGLTPKRVREVHSNFHQWARPFVSHLPDDFGSLPIPYRLFTAGRRAQLRAKSAAKLVVERVTRRSAG